MGWKGGKKFVEALSTWSLNVFQSRDVNILNGKRARGLCNLGLQNQSIYCTCCLCTKAAKVRKTCWEEYEAASLYLRGQLYKVKARYEAIAQCTLKSKSNATR